MPMHADFTAAEIAEYTARQLNAFFPAPRSIDAAVLRPSVDVALARIERCFAAVALPLYSRDGQPVFDPFHSDHYCTYLGYLGNALWRADADPSVMSRVFSLNKALHSFNCMWDNPLPDIILLVHVLGTVLGKAVLPNYLAVMQGATIGAIGGVYPTLGEGLIMSAGSSVIGPCTVGRNVMLESHVHVVKTDLPANVRVGGSAPFSMVAQNDRALRYFFRLPNTAA